MGSKNMCIGKIIYVECGSSMEFMLTLLGNIICLKFCVLENQFLMKSFGDYHEGKLCAKYSSANQKIPGLDQSALWSGAHVQTLPSLAK